MAPTGTRATSVAWVQSCAADVAGIVQGTAAIILVLFLCLRTRSTHKRQYSRFLGINHAGLLLLSSVCTRTTFWDGWSVLGTAGLDADAVTEAAVHSTEHPQGFEAESTTGQAESAVPVNASTIAAPSTSPPQLHGEESIPATASGREAKRLRLEIRATEEGALNTSIETETIQQTGSAEEVQPLNTSAAESAPTAAAIPAVLPAAWEATKSLPSQIAALYFRRGEAATATPESPTAKETSAQNLNHFPVAAVPKKNKEAREGESLLLSRPSETTHVKVVQLNMTGEHRAKEKDIVALKDKATSRNVGSSTTGAKDAAAQRLLAQQRAARQVIAAQARGRAARKGRAEAAEERAAAASRFEQANNPQLDAARRAEQNATAAADRLKKMRNMSMLLVASSRARGAAARAARAAAYEERAAAVEETAPHLISESRASGASLILDDEGWNRRAAEAAKRRSSHMSSTSKAIAEASTSDREASNTQRRELWKERESGYYTSEKLSSNAGADVITSRNQIFSGRNGSEVGHRRTDRRVPPIIRAKQLEHNNVYPDEKQSGLQPTRQRSGFTQQQQQRQAEDKAYLHLQQPEVHGSESSVQGRLHEQEQSVANWQKQSHEKNLIQKEAEKKTEEEKRYLVQKGRDMWQQLNSVTRGWEEEAEEDERFTRRKRGTEWGEREGEQHQRTSEWQQRMREEEAIEPEFDWSERQQSSNIDWQEQGPVQAQSVEEIVDYEKDKRTNKNRKTNIRKKAEKHSRGRQHEEKVFSPYGYLRQEHQSDKLQRKPHGNHNKKLQQPQSEPQRTMRPKQDTQISPGSTSDIGSEEKDRVPSAHENEQEENDDIWKRNHRERTEDWDGSQKENNTYNQQPMEDQQQHDWNRPFVNAVSLSQARQLLQEESTRETQQHNTRHRRTQLKTQQQRGQYSRGHKKENNRRSSGEADFNRHTQFQWMQMWRQKPQRTHNEGRTPQQQIPRRRSFKSKRERHMDIRATRETQESPWPEDPEQLLLLEEESLQSLTDGEGGSSELRMASGNAPYHEEQRHEKVGSRRESQQADSRRQVTRLSPAGKIRKESGYIRDRRPQHQQLLVRLKTSENKKNSPYVRIQKPATVESRSIHKQDKWSAGAEQRESRAYSTKWPQQQQKLRQPYLPRQNAHEHEQVQATEQNDPLHPAFSRYFPTNPGADQTQGNREKTEFSYEEITKEYHSMREQKIDVRDHAGEREISSKSLGGPRRMPQDNSRRYRKQKRKHYLQKNEGPKKRWVLPEKLHRKMDDQLEWQEASRTDEDHTAQGKEQSLKPVGAETDGHLWDTQQQKAYPSNQKPYPSKAEDQAEDFQHDLDDTNTPEDGTLIVSWGRSPGQDRMREDTEQTEEQQLSGMSQAVETQGREWQPIQQRRGTNAAWRKEAVKGVLLETDDEDRGVVILAEQGRDLTEDSNSQQETVEVLQDDTSEGQQWEEAFQGGKAETDELQDDDERQEKDFEHEEEQQQQGEQETQPINDVEKMEQKDVLDIKGGKVKQGEDGGQKQTAIGDRAVVKCCGDEPSSPHLTNLLDVQQQTQLLRYNQQLGLMQSVDEFPFDGEAYNQSFGWPAYEEKPEVYSDPYDNTYWQESEQIYQQGSREQQRQRRLHNRRSQTHFVKAFQQPEWMSVEQPLKTDMLFRTQQQRTHAQKRKKAKERYKPARKNKAKGRFKTTSWGESDFVSQDFTPIVKRQRNRSINVLSPHGLWRKQQQQRQVDVSAQHFLPYYKRRRSRKTYTLQQPIQGDDARREKELSDTMKRYRKEKRRQKRKQVGTQHQTRKAIQQQHYVSMQKKKQLPSGERFPRYASNYQENETDADQQQLATIPETSPLTRHPHWLFFNQQTLSNPQRLSKAEELLSQKFWMQNDFRKYLQDVYDGEPKYSRDILHLDELSKKKKQNKRLRRISLRQSPSTQDIQEKQQKKNVFYVADQRERAESIKMDQQERNLFYRPKRRAKTEKKQKKEQEKSMIPRMLPQPRRLKSVGKKLQKKRAPSEPQQQQRAGETEKKQQEVIDLPHIPQPHAKAEKTGKTQQAHNYPLMKLARLLEAVNLQQKKPPFLVFEPSLAREDFSNTVPNEQAHGVTPYQHSTQKRNQFPLIKAAEAKWNDVVLQTLLEMLLEKRIDFQTAKKHAPFEDTDTKKEEGGTGEANEVAVQELPETAHKAQSSADIEADVQAESDKEHVYEKGMKT